MIFFSAGVHSACSTSVLIVVDLPNEEYCVFLNVFKKVLGADEVYENEEVDDLPHTRISVFKK